MSLFRRRRGTTDLIPRGESRYSLEQYVQQLSFAFGGSSYDLGFPGNQVQTLYGPNPVEPIPNSLVGYTVSALFDNAIVAGLEWVRLNVFSEARFAWRQLRSGKTGDLFGTADLALLENPWIGGTTGDLLMRMLLDADLAGNAFWAKINGELVRLRPDWVDIVLEPRVIRMRMAGDDMPRQVGWRKIAYAYWQGGKSGDAEPAIFLPDEVCHFAPLPDPLASFRGMSWLTPVIREIQADKQAILHQQQWWENAASPNIAVSLKDGLTPKQFREFVAAMEESHKGPENAGKTLYLGGGADVTVIGKDMVQADYSNVIGKGETRIALAAGIHPVVAGLSEGMQGSSLNAGNYQAAKRATGDRTFRPLWRNVCGSLQTLFPPPKSSQLWYDVKDVAFLRDDLKDVADVRWKEAYTIRNLLDAGFTPKSATAAVMANDWALLQHSGLYSVQLQAPGTGAPPAATTQGPAPRSADPPMPEFPGMVLDAIDVDGEEAE